MAIYKKATRLLIPPGANDPAINPRIGILHVDAGNAASLYDYFKNRSGGVESHFHIPKVGNVEQYRDTGYEADANYKANPFAISVETQGYGQGTWNKHQLHEIKSLMLWCYETHQIPLRKVTSWNDSKGGWGYHTLFPEWHPVPKSCPGADRIQQFEDELVPWMRETVADMAFDKKQEERLARVEVKLDKVIKKLDTFRTNELKRDKKGQDTLNEILTLLKKN